MDNFIVCFAILLIAIAVILLRFSSCYSNLANEHEDIFKPQIITEYRKKAKTFFRITCVLIFIGIIILIIAAMI